MFYLKPFKTRVNSDYWFSAQSAPKDLFRNNLFGTRHTSRMLIQDTLMYRG